MSLAFLAAMCLFFLGFSTHIVVIRIGFLFWGGFVMLCASVFADRTPLVAICVCVCVCVCVCLSLFYVFDALCMVFFVVLVGRPP